jgi:DNA (cytosine-5)-methyltransferase 1
MSGLLVDLFAGAGGASVGIEAALGRPVDVAVNHDATAIAVHTANHPTTVHHATDVWEVDPQQATGGRPVELLWASPDCRHFSRAKGGVPRSPRVRSLAWVVVRWAKAVRPRVIALENVPEFRTWGPLRAGAPDRARAGETFDEWVHALRRLGYQVEDRVLDASLFGAPTRRRRLFIVARCDGEPIRWPAPTHGPGLLPVRTAAECIDWSLPCPSIFDRKRPLADATLRRVAEGIRRFVLGTAQPFVVHLPHGGGARMSRKEPTPPPSPAPQKPPPSPTPPAPRFATVAPLVAPTLIQTGHGEREGQAPRVPGLHKPLGAVVAGGSKRALVAAFLAHHYGGEVGREADRPLGVVTARDHHSLVAASITKWYGTAIGQGLDDPLHTATAKARFALVEAFLERHGMAGPHVVKVSGESFAIVDIGLRMLEPHELLHAQFGEHAGRIDLGAAATKAAKIRLIGNSVVPQVAEAIVRANLRGAPAVKRQGALFGVKA